MAGSAVLFVLATTLGVSRLKPAAPSVARAAVVLDTVKRGPMVRQVRGLGTLVPEEIRWIPAATEGRVERIVVQPGTRVEADTVLVELSNPEVELRAIEAESQLRAAEAAYNDLRVRLQSQRLDQEAAAARVQAEYAAGATARRGRRASWRGRAWSPTSRRKISRSAADELANRVGIERQAPGHRARGHRRRSSRSRRPRSSSAARSRACASSSWRASGCGRASPACSSRCGVEVGQQVTPGTNLARVAQPDRLKAVIRVPETQARDVLLGQPAAIDTRNGIVPGHVARIDPAAQNGTVTVDVALEGPLPRRRPPRPHRRRHHRASSA